MNKNWMTNLIFIIVIFIYNNNHASVKDLYLDIMKRCLINSIYEDASVQGTYNNQSRELGRDWPSVAHTMIGLKRLNNVQYCIEDVIKNNISGDFIETGVWRGGTCIFMRAILKAYNIKNRNVWVADSFEGLPLPNTTLYPQDEKFTGISAPNCPFLAISIDTVKSNFAKYDLLDSQVKFLKGWFKDTLSTPEIQQLAILRLDGDFYESTMDALNALYNKLSIGGYVIVDDYYALDACEKAVSDFRKDHGIVDPIIEIDGTGVFWKKTK